MSHVVVVGAGHAGVEFCDALRERDPVARITLLEAQSGLPYQRPPLSKDALDTAIAATLPLRAESFYQERNITRLAPATVVAIDRGQRCVRLSDGRLIRYDHLVLATGAEPVDPGFAAEGALTLRTQADAARVLQALRPQARIVLVGAGFVGLEVASAALARGCEVQAISSGSRVLSRSVSPPMSAAIRTRHEARGMRFLLGTPVAGIEREQSSAHVVLADGARIAADAIVVGVGVRPNAELAQRAGLDVSDGILVDANLRTSDPDISAIGDCVRFWAPDGSRRLESVPNATGHARHLAASLAGAAPPAYDEVPWFWSVQGAHRLQIAGVVPRHGEHVETGTSAEAAYAVFSFDAGGWLAAVETLNRPAVHVAARTALATVPPHRDELERYDFDVRSWQRERGPIRERAPL